MIMIDDEDDDEDYDYMMIMMMMIMMIPSCCYNTFQSSLFCLLVPPTSSY